MKLSPKQQDHLQAALSIGPCTFEIQKDLCVIATEYKGEYCFTVFCFKYDKTFFNNVQVKEQDMKLAYREMLSRWKSGIELKKVCRAVA